MHAPMHILTPIPLRTLCFEAYNGALHQCRNSFKSTYGCIFVHTALQIGAFAATHSLHTDTHIHAFIPTQTESWSHWGNVQTWSIASVTYVAPVPVSLLHGYLASNRIALCVLLLSSAFTQYALAEQWTRCTNPFQYKAPHTVKHVFSTFNWLMLAGFVVRRVRWRTVSDKNV